MQNYFKKLYQKPKQKQRDLELYSVWDYVGKTRV